MGLGLVFDEVERRFRPPGRMQVAPAAETGRNSGGWVCVGAQEGKCRRRKAGAKEKAGTMWNRIFHQTTKDTYVPHLGHTLGTEESRWGETTSTVEMKADKLSCSPPHSRWLPLLSYYCQGPGTVLTAPG